MKNEELIVIFAHSRTESHAATWSKIMEFIKSGGDLFSSFTLKSGEQDPLIYFAINLCNASIVKSLLEYARDIGKNVDLSYHQRDIGTRKKTGEQDERLEWNVLQHAAVFNDLAVVKVLCEYAAKNKQNPADIIQEDILIGDRPIFVGELMIGSLSFQATYNLDTSVYSLEEQRTIRKKLVNWTTGLDQSLEHEFNKTNPLKLKWYGRRDVFEYLMRNEYIKPRSLTTTGKPFYEWLYLVTKNPAIICKVIRAHSDAMLKQVRVFETEPVLSEHKEGPVTATGLLSNVGSKCPIHIEVDIVLSGVNKLVNDAIIKEDEEAEHQKNLELLRASAPAPVINRRSFDEVKDEVKEVSQTVANISEVRIKRYNSSKSFEEKAFFNTVYQTILTHMSARKLTATELLDANPVSRNAKIGKLLQTAFSIAMTASPAAQALPEITKVFLNVATSRHAKKQSEAVFKAYLISSVESLLLDLSEQITTEVMELYRNQRSNADFGAIAAEVADIIIKRSDRELHHADITNEDQLFAFLLKQSLVALEIKGKKDKADPFALHALQSKIRDMSSNTTPTSGSEISDKATGRRQQMVAYKGYEEHEPKKNGPGGCCNIS
jgi:hypothetical protein